MRSFKPALVLLLPLVFVAACTSGSGVTSQTGGASSDESSGGTSAGTLSPLTGKSVESLGPVLAVKVDNVGPARPQTGLTSADVVYVEPVEGGLSRILAVFSSRLPSLVGPVRSARESDLDLLGQYGPVALAFSGANAGVLKSIRDSDLLEASPDRASSAYSRRGPHAAPHNLYASPKALLSAVGGASATAHDIGFRFGPAPDGGVATDRKVVSYASASTGFTWSPASNRWNVSFDGRAATTTDGGRLSAPTVVIQYTEVTSSKYHDVLGNPTPFTQTVGSGRAVVLRGGQAYDARWSRTLSNGGTTYTTASGATLPFAAGQVWIVYQKVT